MNEVQIAIELAMKKWREEIANGGSFNNGDEFVAILNNCCIHISLEDGHFRTQFVPDVVRVDMDLSIYGKGEE